MGTQKDRFMILIMVCANESCLIGCTGTSRLNILAQGVKDFLKLSENASLSGDFSDKYNLAFVIIFV